MLYQPWKLCNNELRMMNCETCKSKQNTTVDIHPEEVMHVTALAEKYEYL
jgi:hypothetical protein